MFRSAGLGRMAFRWPLCLRARVPELEQLQAEKAAGALTELVEPRTVSAFALQAEARREEARALEEQLEAERQHERDSNRAVHIRWRGKPTLCRSDADPLPKGCRVYRTAVTTAVALHLAVTCPPG